MVEPTSRTVPPGATRHPLARIAEVAGPAALAFVICLAFGDPSLGLLLAAALVGGELVWHLGACALRAARRRSAG